MGLVPSDDRDKLVARLISHAFKLFELTGPENSVGVDSDIKN
jgi:hypothetical protein